jgi:hypothetical protein
VEPQSPTASRGPVRRGLIACGKVFLLLGLSLLAAVLVDVVPASAFTLGGETGLRVVGGISVLGCIMLAFGYYDE